MNSIYRRIYVFVVSKILFRKYKDIWKIKEYLKSTDKLDNLHLSIYDEYFRKLGSWIGYNAIFQGVPCFPHGVNGIFISGGSEIGKNVVIFQQVTIGSNTIRGSEKFGSPTIGNNVYIGAGAKIIGKIKVGDNCRIGANAVVYKDMLPNSVAIQAETRIIQKHNLDNRFYSQRNGEWVYYNNGVWINDNSELETQLQKDKK